MSAQKIGTGHRGRARWRKDGSLWTIYGGMDHQVHLDHRTADGTRVEAWFFDAGMSGLAGATLSELSGPDLWEDAAGVLWAAWRIEVGGFGYGQLWNDQIGFVLDGKDRPVWSSNPWAFGAADWIGWQAASDHWVYASPLAQPSRVERLGPGDSMGLSRLNAQPSGLPAFFTYPSESYHFFDGPWGVHHLGGGHGARITHDGEPNKERHSFNGQDANQPWIAGHPDAVHAAVITHGAGAGVRIDCFTKADLVPVTPPQPTPIPPKPKPPTPKPPIPIPPEPVPVPPAPITRWRRRPMFAIRPFDHAVLKRFEDRLVPGGDLADSSPGGQIPSSSIEVMKVEFMYYITSLGPVPPGDWTDFEKQANDHITKLWNEGLPNP